MRTKLFLLLLIVGFHPIAVYAQTGSIQQTALPILKDGRWKLVISPVGGSAALLSKTEVIFCTDKNTQNRMIDLALKKANCTNFSVKKNSTNYSATAECNLLGKTSYATSELNFINENSARGEANIKNELMQLNAAHKADYLGNCRPGEKPGAYQYTVEESPAKITDLNDLQDIIGNFNFNS